MSGVRVVCWEDSTRRWVWSCRQPGGSFPLPVPPDPSTRPPSDPRSSSLRLREEVGGALGAFPPRWCAATGSEMAGKDGGKGGSGVPAVTVAGPPPPSVTAPRQQRSPNPRAKGARPVTALSPLLALPAADHAGIFWGAELPLQGHDHFPTPAHLQPGGAGRGGLSPVHRRARGLFLGHDGRPSECKGSVAMSATHPTRLETRTKESNMCTSQGLTQKMPGCNEGEGCLIWRLRWDPEASPVH